MSKILVNQEDLVAATTKLMDFCQQEGISELLAYMAMITITKSMEENLGFGTERRVDA
jgi:hypothetical protein